MTEIPIDPPVGAFDWLLKSQHVRTTVDKAVDDDGCIVRIEIEARARVYPNTLWALLLFFWGLAVLIILAIIASHTARADDGWYSDTWGKMRAGQTQTVQTWVGPDGKTHHCVIYRWRGETRMQCD